MWNVNETATTPQTSGSPAPQPPGSPAPSHNKTNYHLHYCVNQYASKYVHLNLLKILVRTCHKNYHIAFPSCLSNCIFPDLFNGCRHRHLWCVTFVWQNDSSSVDEARYRRESPQRDHCEGDHSVTSPDAETLQTQPHLPSTSMSPHFF